ncbi:hypothetical protein [Novosphingobium pentaromativorans]|uniref:Cytochrome P450 n=1 Tax=Novosphingobium pentaromativorans US6-1 TaxID=1088721 RepID=G6EH12_9SPHN|nr:hypothetical protein [Novosphingobium pentaromativorans]EHJ59301.1 cytochrome P450 [Novosphingobium pentaromativorans US6-1]
MDVLEDPGFTFDPYSPGIDANQFPAYKILRDEYPCFWSEQAGKWVLSRYDDILAALPNWRIYSSAKGNLVDEFPGRAGSTLGSFDPPRHDRLRGLIQSAVTKRALDHLIAPAKASARMHLAALEGRESFDFVGEFGSKVTVDLLFHLFALPRRPTSEARKRFGFPSVDDQTKGPAGSLRRGLSVSAILVPYSSSGQ